MAREAIATLLSSTRSDATGTELRRMAHREVEVAVDLAWSSRVVQPVLPATDHSPFVVVGQPAIRPLAHPAQSPLLRLTDGQTDLSSPLAGVAFRPVPGGVAHQTNRLILPVVQYR